MNATIASYGVISPQQTHDVKGFPENLSASVAERLSCLEPDYRQHIPAIQLRRMPRILKMGLASARICLGPLNGVEPDAIVVGTGLGCLESLEKFLVEVLEKHEQVTSVLPFINSTHNAVASQIAMMLKNYGYNNTYCHRAMSFESALQDALLLLEEGRAAHVLAGGIDECTADFVHLQDYLGRWKKPRISPGLFAEKTPGTIAGEGSAFFLLSALPQDGSHICLKSVRTVFSAGKDLANTIGNETGKDLGISAGYKGGSVMSKAGGKPTGIVGGSPADQAFVAEEIDAFLSDNHLNRNDIDVVLMGLSGDYPSDSIYHRLMQSYFNAESIFAAFKHLCGEYHTASAFALWLGTVMLREQQVPAVIRIGGGQRRKLNHILIYNHFMHTEHAFMLLSLSPSC